MRTGAELSLPRGGVYHWKTFVLVPFYYWITVEDGFKKKCVCLSVIPVLTQFSERQGGNFPRGSSVQRKRKQKVDWKNHSVGRVFKCLLLRGQLSAEWFSDVTVQGLLSQNTSSFNFVFRP